MYEVEKRSRPLTETQFRKVRQQLEKKGSFLGHAELISYLFSEPRNLRIRFIKGKDFVTVTRKTGEYTDIAREESEETIPLEKVDNYIHKAEKEGYQYVVRIQTLRDTYMINDLKVELNDIEHLGLIVEVEALTEDKAEIPMLKRKIEDIMQALNIPEIEASNYKGLIGSVYDLHSKNISEVEFV